MEGRKHARLLRLLRTASGLRTRVISDSEPTFSTWKFFKPSWIWNSNLECLQSLLDVSTCTFGRLCNLQSILYLPNDLANLSNQESRFATHLGVTFDDLNFHMKSDDVQWTLFIIWWSACFFKPKQKTIVFTGNLLDIKGGGILSGYCCLFLNPKLIYLHCLWDEQCSC